MRRLPPLLAFALVPAVLAAPVPPAPAPEFGANGLLTRADLGQVKFASRPDPDAAKREKPRDVEDAVKRVARDGPVKPRPASEYDIAIHLAQTRFREGDPAPAYFVVRNNRDKPLRLRSRLDVCDPEPRGCGNHCKIDIRDRATGESVVGGAHVTNCDARALVVVPADGFHCVRADLNRLAGRVLPPGDYELSWHYADMIAAPVRFSVLARPGAKVAALPKLPRLSLYHLTEDTGFARTEEQPRPGEAVSWPECELDDVPTDDFAAALAGGPHGVYAPDLRAVPQADKLVEAWMEWHPYREADRVRVTLRAAPAQRAVCVDEVPQLYLMLETTEDAPDRRFAHQERKLMELARERVRTLPLTIEVDLPAGWRDQIVASGTVRLSVLVVSGRVELPRDRECLKHQEREAADIARGDTPVWSGVVRTNSAELRVQLPPQPLFAR